jgi:SAM-dependent methyltransferase
VMYRRDQIAGYVGRRVKRLRRALRPADERPYADRNSRRTCVCGRPRRAVARNIWRVIRTQDQVNAQYCYRCGDCGTFSAVNLRFEPNSYSRHPIDAYSIPPLKVEVNDLRVAFMRERVTLPSDQPVIYDLGSGEGAFTAAWRRALPLAEIVSVEADERMLDKFHAEYAGSRFVRAYIEDFLAEAVLEPRADVLLLTDVLEHVVDPDGLLKLMMGALRPGGVAYITLPTAASFAAPTPCPPGEVDWAIANVTCQHLWLMDPALLVAMMRRHGELLDHSDRFETDLRRDAVYSTFLLRRRG